jgi:hypothetical protein
MKTLLHCTVTALLWLFLLHLQSSTCQAQGSLTPPGAPAPTMKSLDQVEARTAITTDGAVTIYESGSYYLTRNLTVSSGTAITISANGVTLDLNGFTISSTDPSTTGTGVLLNFARNVTIHNGHIGGEVTNDGSGYYSGHGFSCGIIYQGPQPQNVLISRVSVSGCMESGIYVGSSGSTAVESCTVRTVGGHGILASTIKTSVAMDCGASAIYGQQVSDCRGWSGSGYGVYAATAQNCYGSSGSGTGISANTAQNCYGSSGSGTGISANTAQNCYGSSSGSDDGVFAETAQNCRGFSNNGFGVYAFRTAIGCYGASSTGTGLYALNASTCTGYRPGGTAIQATVANGCYAAAGSNVITHKYNMP